MIRNGTLPESEVPRYILLASLPMSPRTIFDFPFRLR